MFQRIWSGLTTATVLVASLGIGSPSPANPTSEVDDVSPTNVSQPEMQSEEVPASAQTEVYPGTPQVLQTTEVAIDPSVPAESPAVDEVSKVGEYQSQETETAAIATLHSHSLDGHQATTVYVRSIPVLTFLGDRLQATPQAVPSSQSVTPVSAGPASDFQATAYAAPAEEVKLPASSQMGVPVPVQNPTATPLAQIADPQGSDASWRAGAIAARINQFSREGMDPNSIVVRWDAQQRSPVIQAGETELVAITAGVLLPDTTRNPSEDALQVANRLRRLLGNATPLTEIIGAPRPEMQVSLGRIQARLSGIASWYGPGFHGNRSASGERFNQHDLTAAHRTLPFGTRVRVTNVRTGRSVIVRINDRGPFSRGRVIDLSAAAARAIGMMGTGVAPVRLEVLSNRTAYP